MEVELFSDRWIDEKTKRILDGAVKQIRNELRRREKKGNELAFNYLDRMDIESRWASRITAITEALKEAKTGIFTPLFGLIRKDKSIMFHDGVRALILRMEEKPDEQFFKGLGGAIGSIRALKEKKHQRSWEIIGKILNYRNGRLLHLIQEPKGFNIFLETITAVDFPFGEFVPDAWTDSSYFRKQLKQKGFLTKGGNFGRKKAEKPS